MPEKPPWVGFTQALKLEHRDPALYWRELGCSQ